MSNQQKSESQIAIVGFAGRFPSCDDVGQFWDCLVEGRGGIKTVQPNPNSRLHLDPNYVAKAATVEQADHFDAAFFGILPRPAQEMDPQHRLFLEICWNALEDAGYRPDATEGRVGVFAGCHMNTYIFLRLAADVDLRESLADSFPGGNLNAEILNDKDYLATRIAYHLNLRGPAVAVQSACSTSLVAVAQACQSLEAGDCRMALAGGACITFPQDQGYLHTEDSILSPDGICRTFDADAKGTIFADGVGAVVLKRLSDARQDGDAIYAVIKGWGVNNDGGFKGGYTAPSVNGQCGAIERALEKAGISADTISYVEAHGTGTLVGDPIEIAALTQAFRKTTVRNQFCSIGSLKSNFGHLDVAAGVAAVIKTSLALHNHSLPPNLHFSRPNPSIDFVNSPFFVQTRLTDWPRPQIDNQAVPRRAGVSSFGVGGTNAHLVMEEYDTNAEDSVSPPEHATPRLACLSANNPQSLQRMCSALADRLEADPDLNLRDASFTLMAGRKPLPFRLSAAGKTATEWIEQLRAANRFQAAAASPKLLFLFPGQGSQHVGMAAELYRSDRRFAKHLDDAAETLLPHTQVDLRSLVFGTDLQLSRIDETAYAQPSIFMVSYALAKWLQEMGIKPDYVMGHSVGEFAAATISGIVSLADGARMIAARGRLMQELPTGSMLAVTVDSSRLKEILPDGLEMAALNAPSLNVVSGPSDKIRALEKEIENGKYGDEITGRLLRTSHAFHSAMMDPAIEPFGRIVAQCQLKLPKDMAMISTVTSDQITDAQAASVDYWAHQIRRPVAFSETMARLLAAVPNLIICEVGPNQALTALVRQQSLKAGSQVVVSLLPHVKDQVPADRFAFSAIGKLWQAGLTMEAATFFVDSSDCRRVHLPTYSFERKRHWFQVWKTLDEQPRNVSLPEDKDEEPAEVQTMQIAQLAALERQSEASQTVELATEYFGESGATGRESLTHSQFGLELIKRQMDVMRRQVQLIIEHNDHK